MLHTSNLKTLDTSSLTSVFQNDEAPAARDARAELRKGLRLVTKEQRRRQLTLTNSRRAAEQLKRLPARCETVHLVLKANNFAPFDLLPAFIELAGRPATEVWLTSLGINDRHVQALDELLTAGKIKRCSLLLSHYFSKVDSAEYCHAVHVLTKHGGTVRAERSHAKLILARFGRTQHIVCESSGNLRSCRSIEQAAIFNDAKLFAFHRGWIEELLSETSQ
jgi:hypothetical protein